ncbi:MAG: hypothetical protein WBO31_08405 [Saprospiraceae bacterium]
MYCFNPLFLVFLFYAYTGIAQPAFSNKNFQGEVLPKVFLIGEYEKPFEEMSSNYSTLLLNNYQDDLDKAFNGWTSVLVGMEDYANTISFDLRGLKLWVNIFFNVDGSIQHLVYYPKPNSKNMDFELLTNFFISFCNTYRFKDPISKKCSHIGSASFPTFSKRN